MGGSKLASGRRGKEAIRRGAQNYEIRADFVAQTVFGELLDTAIDSSQTLPPKPDPARPFWYFSSWRAPLLVGPVDVTVGKRGVAQEKTDLNRLLNVKQQLANSAAIERFRSRQHSLISTYSDG